jgi:hypothetical protein
MQIKPGYDRHQGLLRVSAVAIRANHLAPSRRGPVLAIFARDERARRHGVGARDATGARPFATDRVRLDAVRLGLRSAAALRPPAQAPQPCDVVGQVDRVLDAPVSRDQPQIVRVGRVDEPDHGDPGPSGAHAAVMIDPSSSIGKSSRRLPFLCGRTAHRPALS